MDKRLKLNNEITVGGQPTKDELQELALEGYRSVVNLRYAGEESEQLSPATKGGVVQRRGMGYDHFPVAAEALTAETVNQFRKLFAELPRPAFVHCKSGKRAAVIGLVQLASERARLGWTEGTSSGCLDEDRP